MFGLDISETAIKVMEVNRIGGVLVPVAVSSVQLPDKFINNHMIISEERLAETIKHAIKKAKKIDTDYVVCSVPEAKSFVRVLSVPKMPEEEIDGAIPYELEQDIPVPIDQVYMDWHLLREHPDKLELLVTAAPKDYVDSLIATLKMCRLTPLAMELESQATARALVGPNDSQKTMLIVDMATKQTSFIIVDKGVIEYTSSVPIAGDSFTESIARNLSVSKSEAEKLKKIDGLTSELKKSNIREAIIPVLDNIIDEIRNVLKFFEEHGSSKRNIQDIILCGGTAQLLGVADYISARINLGSQRSSLGVVLGNPLNKLSGISSFRL